MSLRSLCLDTNTYTALLAGSPEAAAIIGSADQVWLPAPVLGELRAGFRKGRKAAENELLLQEFMASAHVHVADVNEPVTRRYAAVFDQLRQSGKPVPTNDLWIAACALQMDCPLYSLDQHFTHVQGLALIQDAADWDALTTQA